MREADTLLLCRQACFILATAAAAAADTHSTDSTSRGASRGRASEDKERKRKRKRKTAYRPKQARQSMQVIYKASIESVLTCADVC
jgi:hypothetical protein